VPIASSLRIRSIVCGCAAALLAAAPRAVAAQEAAAQTSEETAARRPFAAFSASAAAIRDSLVAVARAQIGSRYRLGGQSPERGFDCSGLMKYIMAALHVDLPRTAREQATLGKAVPRDRERMKPGDLLTFGRGSRITHIGIYVGDGHFVHASTKTGRVIESSLDRKGSPLLRRWSGVRRLAMADSGS
jgi:cell wall-associated NlpC family hydrolase